MVVMSLCCYKFIALIRQSSIHRNDIKRRSWSRRGLSRRQLLNRCFRWIRKFNHCGVEFPS